VIRHVGRVAVDERERRVGHDPAQDVGRLVAQVEEHVVDVQAAQDLIPAPVGGLEREEGLAQVVAGCLVQPGHRPRARLGQDGGAHVGEREQLEQPLRIAEHDRRRAGQAAELAHDARRDPHRLEGRLRTIGPGLGRVAHDRPPVPHPRAQQGDDQRDRGG